ncbi:alpha/beta hydrolase domain-containing protein [Xanthocytophaga agilis]|uniref:Alpha/beta hydrolase domain-containing protein n=1 Tax=Xanthocytophaga agilis TaxID=3048010 RepID=A0AAE3UGA7_9BACT|nr:alpha/beta hydrolase domain-containing protein [Xanthocytophaga agilis]MDJ1501423.1 alpha/beta hydrolase domain-containing protein [Xanthocytophaga agilis]
MKRLVYTSFFLLSITLRAEIVKILITKTEPYENGRLFGTIGSYEKVYGQIVGEVDPKHTLNRIIQDIDLAPKNAREKVEYISEFILLRPKDNNRNNGILFLSLPNRGNVFPPDTTLLKRGYVYLWCAWQGDVLAGNNRLTMKVPVATENGKEITGMLRTEYQVLEPTQTLNLSSGAFSGNTHHSYETISLDNRGLVLTKRIHEADTRVSIPNTEWAFSDCSVVPFPGTPSTTQISLKEKFDPNYIYELIYIAKNPLIMGLGFAAIRDIVSFLRYQTQDQSGNSNPLITGTSIPIRATILQGVSQCSNFARTFLHLGFNQDENLKQVFDGVNAHIAPRRISLNVRFGRPGGGGLQHEDHLFPSNEPPFTWDVHYDPVSGITSGILEKCIQTGTCPKVIQTLSSSEYWQLRASLPTTDSYGKKDLVLPPNVRIYHFAGTQHTPYGITDKSSGFMTNPNSYIPYLRAILISLEEWIVTGKTPPESVYSTIAKGTLVSPDQKSTGWPKIPKVPYSGLVNKIPLLDFGPGFTTKYTTGILREPPKIIPGKNYTVLVPKVDPDGNELDGIRNITIRVPLGTYTGWSIRQKGFGEGDLASLSGMFIPFAKTKQERITSGDPRLSLEERYGSHEGYVSAVRKAAEELVKAGFLLPEDAQNEITKAEQSDTLNSR